MSEALERVIAEQQKEIDRLRLMVENSNKRRQHDSESVERLAHAVFSVLNHPECAERRFELKQAIMAMGFCPRCEQRPCECWRDDCDD